jgi:hypothetical protein
VADADVTEGWGDLYRVLPDGWSVMRPQWQGDLRVWVIDARNLTVARRALDPWAEAFGETEAIALRALAQQFRRRQT